MPDLAELSGLDEPSRTDAEDAFVDAKAPVRSVPDLARLGQLNAPPQTDMHDPFGDAEQASARPADPPSWMRFVSRPRGIRQPILGHLTDATVLKALAASHKGWLSSNGRILANGTFDSLDAMRTLPEMSPIFEAWNEALERTKKLNDMRDAERLAKHLAGGEPEETFRREDDWHSHEIEAKRAIEALGWVELTPRRDGGVKEVRIDGGRSVPASLVLRLGELAKALGCRIVSGTWGPERDILFDASGRRQDPAPTRSWQRAPSASPYLGDTVAERTEEDVAFLQAEGPRP